MPPAEPATEPGEWVPEKAAARHRKWQSELDVTEEQVRLIQSRYFAKIGHVDACMGRVLEAFEERGWLDDTAVVFWSDHGEMLCDKRRMHKGVYYEPSVHIPLVIRRPGGKNAGSVAEGLAEITDLFPTILDLAGCPPKDGAFGRSLVPMCDDPDETVRDAVFSEIDAAGGRQTMIRDERYKMAVDDEGDGLMLYDLVEDPIERVNLLGKPGMEDVEARLRDRLLRWHAETALDQRIARAGFTSPGPPVRGT
jgi:arylsulfatase A-like enzyme